MASLTTVHELLATLVFLAAAHDFGPFVIDVPSTFHVEKFEFKRGRPYGITVKRDSSVFMFVARTGVKPGSKFGEPDGIESDTICGHAFEWRLFWEPDKASTQGSSAPKLLATARIENLLGGPHVVHDVYVAAETREALQEMKQLVHNISCKTVNE